MKNVNQWNIKDKTKLGFSGHETFTFRYTWLKKAVDVIANEPAFFSKETAMIELGVGKNMVTSIKHWAILSCLIEETEDHKYVVSDFGKRLLGVGGWDPYLEDVASLWLLHWRISTRPSLATTWFFAFNNLSQIEFTKEQLAHEITLYAESKNAKYSSSIIERDVDCFIRTYVPSRNAKSGVLEDSLDCPLTELGLIRDIGQRGLYAFSRGAQKELPNEVFVYALLEYWNSRGQDIQVLSFEDIAYGLGSPGLVFKLDEDSAAYRLDALERLTKGALSYDETSSLRQVYKHKKVDPESFLQRYYEANEVFVSGDRR